MRSVTERRVLPESSEQEEDEAGRTNDVKDPRRGPLLAPLVARSIVLVYFVAFSALAFLYVLHAGTPFWETVQAAVYLLIICASQVYFSRPDTPLRSPVTYAVLAAQAVLALVPLTQFGQSWVGIPTLLAAGVALVLPPRFGWPCFAAIIALTGFVQSLLVDHVVVIVGLTLTNFFGALQIYGLTRLGRLIPEVHAARAELGNAAVAQERMRFARDLHDLLGLSLATIGPKAAAARQAVDADPERAREELSEILDVSRHALADVRLVASGYRDTSLDEESRTVESLLADSDVDVRVEVSHGELPVHVRTIVVAVLRVGAAEVLRRRGVTRCDITMRQTGDSVVLDIVDDGAPDTSSTPLPSADDGTVENLLARVEALGGALAAVPRAEGGNLLRLTVPLARQRPGDQPDVEETIDQIPRAATRLATALTEVVFFGFFVTGTLRVLLVTLDPIQVVTSVAYMLGLLVLQLFFVSRVDRTLRPPMTYVVLAAQALLVVLPLVQFGPAWASIPGLLMGTALLVLRPPAGWALFLVALAGVTWVQSQVHDSVLTIAGNVGATMLIGLITFGLTWMARAVTQLRAARRELARVAVADERMRFARDLHDLLGLSLSAITLKSELAHRLLAVDPERAKRELTEIVDISRLALADVRLVASGYRELSLNEESRSAESVLVAADVQVRMDLHYGELPTEVRTVLATVLREGVTNVLRHSRKGAKCEITVRQQNRMVLLEIANDGVSDGPALSAGGSGLRNLSDRVTRLGGELTAGLDPDGTFRLRAQVPA